jgi:integrase
MAGQLINRGGGKWLLRVYKGRDARTGARLYRSVTFRGDRGGARAELDRLLRRQAEGHVVGSSNMTVDEHLDEWFERVAANHYSYKTLENYRGILAYDVRSLIGRVRLSELEPRHVQSVLTAMRERGVCSNTRRRLYSVLSTSLDSAVAWGTLEQNPAAQVRIPRREAKEMRAMSREEVRQLLAVTDAGRWAELFRAAVVTGMRPGELFGLRWDDVDFERPCISVQRSLVWKGRPAEGWLLVPPKTKRGLRQVAIPRSLAETLAALRKRQAEAKQRAGCAYQDEGFVFANRVGRPVYPRQFVRHVFKVALARAGLPHSIRLYDLRHTCATLLLKAGEHVKVVSERLGHANVSITLEIYVHVLPGMQEGAAARMERLLGEDAGTPAAHREAHRDDEEGD